MKRNRKAARGSQALVTAAIAGMIGASALAPRLSHAAGSADVAKAPPADLGLCLGGNSCKGKSECATPDGSNSCKGMNSCRGKGVVAATQAECGKIAAKRGKAGKKVRYQAGTL
jgi:hypothetical protein